MRTFFPFRLVAILAALLACNPAQCQDKPLPQPKRIPVIFDTDIGDDIDDTWALGFLLRCPELDLKLAVGDNGKPEYRARLLAKFLQNAGRTNVAVGMGLDVPKKHNERQAEWIKGFELKSYSGKTCEDGVQAIIDTIMKSPEQITLVCVGPVPNIAEALKREPRIAKNARFVGMHGSLRVGYNGDNTPVAEFNVKEAPKACQAAFSAPWEVTITPLDTCDKIRLTGEQYQRVYQSADPIASAIITNYKLWAKARGMGSPDGVPTGSTVLFDTVAVYLAFSHEWCRMQQVGLRVTDDGHTVEDPSAKKVNVAVEWKDLSALQDLLVKRLTSGKQ